MSYEFADRLIELRKSKGMSQEELAQRIGLSRQAISKWERAESSPDIGNLVALAEVYDLTIDEIVRGVPESDAAVSCESEESTICEEAGADPEESGIESEKPIMNAVAEDLTQPSMVDISTPPLTRTDFAAAPEAPAVVTDQPSQAAPSLEQPSVTNVTIDHMHIDPALLEHSKEPKEKKPKDPLLTFPYPVLCAAIFLIVGFLFGWWHPAWIIFFTIPFYYWIVDVVIKDPYYQARHRPFDE